MKRYIAFIILISLTYFSFCQENSKSGETTYALIEAARLKMLGNLEEAAKLYNAAVNSDPKCAGGWYELASIYSVMGKVAEAEVFISKAYNLDKSNYWYTIAYADVLGLNKKFKEAVKILKHGIQKLPKEEMRFRFQIASNFHLDGNYKMAIKEYENIERKFGISEIISARKIEIYKELKNDEEINSTFINYLAKDPENMPMILMYAEHLSEKGKINEAVNQFEKALRLDDTNIFAISNLADLYSKLGDNEKSYSFLLDAFLSDEISSEKKMQTLSFMMNDEKKITKDKEQLKKLVDALLEKEEENYELLIIAYDFYFKTNDYRKSFELIKKLVDLKEDNYIIWAQALYNGNLLEKYEEVIELGLRALKVFPNKDDLRVFVALALYQIKKFDESYNILKETENRFTEPEMEKQKKLLLAETAYKSGFIEESFESYEELIRSEPDNLYVKNNYSYYLSVEGVKLESARKFSYETILAEPENPTFLDTYGWILYKMADYNEAEKYLRKAFELDDTNNEEIVEHFIEILKVNMKLEEIEKVKKSLSDE